MKKPTKRAWHIYTVAAVSLAALLVLPRAAAAQPASARTPAALRDAAAFQLALTSKIRADEAFLTGDRSQADNLYTTASTELKTVSGAWVADNDALIRLLEADIDYRRMLLRYGADFWGAAYSLTPINPVAAYERFASDVAAFAVIVDQMEQARKDLLQHAANAASVAAAREQAKTEGDVQSLQRIAEEIKRESRVTKATAAQSRIDRNVQRQKDIASERIQLSAQFDAAHKQFDSLVLNAAMQAAGIPPEMQQLAASDKPLEQRILAAGRAMLSQQNSPLLDTFGSYSETTGKILEAARAANEKLSELQKIKGAADAAVSAVRRGTLDGALEAGSIIYDNLPQADKQRLTTIVTREAKPLVALVDTAKNVKGTLNTIATYVTSQQAMRDKLRDVIAERALQNTPAFDRWYRQRIAEAVTQLGGADTLTATEQAVRAWPKAFFDKLPPEMRSALRQTAAVASDAEAARKVFSTWPPTQVQISMKGGSVEVRTGGRTTSVDLRAFVEQQVGLNIEAVEQYAEAAARSTTELATSEMKVQLDALIASAMKDQAAMVARFARTVDQIDESASLSRLLPKSVSEATTSEQKAAAHALFDQLYSQLPAADREATATLLAKLQVGMVTSKDVVGAPERRMPRGNTTSGVPQGKMEEAVARAVLTAAFPAAGVALVAVDAFNAFGEMSRLADRINALYAEDRSIMAEQFALYDLVRDERAAVALAELNIRIADRRRDGSLAQIDKYTSATAHFDNAAQRALYVQRLFMPRALLIADRLRSRYDQLDRSLSFWAGDPRAPHGQIARYTLSDPQWMRYALDPSIQVYKWLDRGGESDRGDFQKLLEDWRRKLDFASEACNELQCKQEAAVVGEVKEGSEISMRDLLPRQWAEYTKWKSGRGGPSEFVFEFLLTPRVLKPNKHMHSIRFVAARAGLRRGDAIRSSDGAALYHSGAAYVPFEDTYHREHYLPQQVLNLTWQPFPDLRTRWRNTTSLAPLEGYGLYTVWRLVLQDTNENKVADDVVLQFAYQYQNRKRVLNDQFLENQQFRNARLRLTYTTADKAELSVPLTELPFFGNEDEARKSLQAILKEPDAAAAGLTRAVLNEEARGGK